THAVTCFAVTATLLSAIVKPFGRPFRITDKGGDRSAPRVHWKLAAVFGLIAASSAASIMWAFISPYAASEISSLDFFNLLWAAIAMLIAFITFLVCFELPRTEPSAEQRQRLVVRLFSASHGNVASEANLRGALAGLLRRGFLGT